MKLIFIILFISLLGCSRANRKPDSEVSLKITIEHLLHKDAWKVVFQTSMPVSNLVFERQINRFRAKNWKSLTPGIKVIEVDGKERIVQSDFKLFNEASFEFSSYYEETPKDYEFFQAFSDKSVVMYTGHYNACPEYIECDPHNTEFVFIPRSDEQGIVSGKIFHQSYNWKEETGRGTYVYFGNLKPIESKSLTAIVDPVLPQWLKQRFNFVLPRLFEYYAKKTGQPLTFKPFIFLNYSSNGEGTSMHGGTLPGLIQMSIEGNGWQKKDIDSFIDLARFFAHESAHVWNGQMFPYASGDMWMHEGGADAFAYFALLDLKLINFQQFLDFQTESFNTCLTKLSDRPLMEVKEDPNFRAHYRCGSILALLTHAAGINSKKDHDLFYFWSQLFNRSKNVKEPYTEEMYFSVLEEMTGNKNLNVAINTILRGPISNAKEFLVSQLNQQHIKLKEADSNFPKSYNIRMGMDLLRAMMKKDCNGKYGITGGVDGLETEAREDCTQFKNSFYITHIQKIPIVTEGAKAYDAARVHCAKKNRDLSLTARGVRGDLKFACPDEISVRAPYLVITGI